MYTLYYSAGGEIFSIKIGAEDLSRLYLHEETVPHALQKLVKAFKKSKFQYHPIIVDEKSKVILDGMHRASAMKKLGYPRVAVCFVNYFSKLIEVRNWYRVFREADLAQVTKIIKDICRNYDLILEEKRIKEYDLRKQSIDSIDLIVGDKVFIIKGPQNKYNLYRIVSYLDNKIKSLSNSIKYLPEKEALSYISKDNVVEKTPIITKKDVVEVALSGKVFPPKTTRHIIPVRPLFINIPLTILKRKDLSLSEVNNIINKILLQKKLVKIRGKIYLDRFYEENHLYLFI